MEVLPPSPRWHMLLPILVVLAGVAAYWNSFDGEFVFDDDQHIVRSHRIRDLSAIREILAVRRPVAEISLAINYAVGKLNVWGYHFFNLTIHLLAGVTLFGVVRRTLLLPSLQERYGKGAAWLALAVSLIWVVHPLQTESVIYVIQRAESMMGLFYLLTLYCVIRGAGSSRSPWWYTTAVASCALGMGCKAVMVTAPVVVGLYDRVLVSRSFRQALRQRWGLYLGLATTWGVLGWLGIVRQVLSPSGTYTGTYIRKVGFGVKGLTPLDYLLTQPGVILHYLEISFWPRVLCLDYLWPVARTAGEIVPPMLVVVALLGATAWGLIRNRTWSFAGAWFFLILLPTSSFIPIKDLAFEHRMYLPLAAVVILVVIAGHASIRALSTRLSMAEPMGRALAAVLVVVVTAALGYRTILRNRDYDSRFTLNQAVVAVRPDNDRAYYNLGNAWTRKGETERAIAAYKEAIRINPRRTDARCNLANRYGDQGRTEDAISEFHRVLRINPHHAQALYNLGWTLFDYSKDTQVQGMNEKAKGLLNESIDLFRRSREVRPRHVPTLRELGDALYRQNEYDQAEELLRASLEIEPGDKLAQRILDQVLAARKRRGTTTGTAGNP